MLVEIFEMVVGPISKVFHIFLAFLLAVAALWIWRSGLLDPHSNAPCAPVAAVPVSPTQTIVSPDDIPPGVPVE